MSDDRMNRRVGEWESGSAGEIFSPSPALKRDVAVLALFAALTIVMTNPLVLHLATAVEDKQDALLNTWIIAWVGHALITDPVRLFDTNIFYPYPNTLAFSEVLLPQGLLALPLNLAFDNTVLGYNFVLLFSLFLAAYAMYLFVFDLTRHRGAALVAGTIFAFNPFNLGNLAQVQLLSFGWLPLALLFLRKTILNSAFVIRNSFLFALFFSIQSLASIYYAFLSGIAAAFYVIWFFVVNRPRPSAFIRVLTNFALSGIIIVVLVVPILLPYLQAQRDLGFQRSVADNEQFSASLKLYSEVSPQNVLYGNLLAPRPPIMLGGYPLDTLFPGLVAVALAVVAVASTNREKWFYFMLLAFAFLLSLGPRLFIAPSLGTDIALPYRWLYDAVPLTHALRAPVRFDALVMFALAVLAGMGMSAPVISIWRLVITNPTGTLRSYELRIAIFLIPLIALEYLALPAANITPVPTGDAIPQYVRWLAKQPRGTVLELPMIASDPNKPLDLTTQYLSTYHWQNTPDGYSGFIPPRRGEIAYEMQFFPDERSIALLRVLDVEYVISQGDPPRNWDSPPVDFQVAQQFGTDRVHRILPAAGEAAALSPRVYLPQPAAPNQTYTAYVIVQNDGKRSFAIKPTDLLQVEARWSDGTTQNVEVILPLVTSTISVVPVRLFAPRSEGTHQLRLRARGDNIGEWNLTGDVAVRAGDALSQVVLPVRVELGGQLKASYVAGENVSVKLLWQALNKIDAYYSVSVRIVDGRGQKIVADDRQPVTPTFSWTPKLSILDEFNLALPRDLAPGEYSVQVLMYQADQGVEAVLLDRELVPRETITLGTFTVK
ncbi:MAG: hypothetical protein HY782_07455 [Chloroflexi bacterium]|nr:hypothetical protein [Chloroflexota bacterium]